MKWSVAFVPEVENQILEHVLRFYKVGRKQEDACFALWNTSTGAERKTALIHEAILPEPGETLLHGGVTATEKYIGRAARKAVTAGCGLAFIHSHPTPGKQHLSRIDWKTEAMGLSMTAQATGRGLLGLTSGSDGIWTARYWEKKGSETGISPTWCENVRVPAKNKFKIDFWDTQGESWKGDTIARSRQCWGEEFQEKLANLRVGVVGVGSVGATVSVMLAKMGIGRLTIIDQDRIEKENLDRIIFLGNQAVGKPKTTAVAEFIRTLEPETLIEVTEVFGELPNADALKAAKDCDLVFSCVDRPLGRATAEAIAYGDLIPVIDGGAAITFDPKERRLYAARWKSQLVIPGKACLQCTEQYTPGILNLEKEGLLREGSYLHNLPESSPLKGANATPFALATAAEQILLFTRYALASDWWPEVSQRSTEIITLRSETEPRQCLTVCPVQARLARGDAVKAI